MRDSDAIDAGSNKKAMQEADKVLKKHPSTHCAKVNCLVNFMGDVSSRRSGGVIISPLLIILESATISESRTISFLSDQIEILCRGLI